MCRCPETSGSIQVCVAPSNMELVNRYVTTLRYHAIRFPSLQVWSAAKPELCYAIAQLTPHVHQPPVLSAEVKVQFNGEVLQITVTEKNKIGVDLFLQV